MSLLERGFKTWAEKFALSLRKEMDMELLDRMEMSRLARWFNARLCTPRDIRGMSEEHLAQLLETDPSGWSAVTVVTSVGAIIIFNPSHSPGRSASNISHEVAHLILEHEPTRLVMSQDGSLVMRSFNAKQEEEANWLAWCLLLPRDALLSSLKRRLTVPDIADTFGVSQSLVKFRMQVTGAQTQLRRARVQQP